VEKPIIVPWQGKNMMGMLHIPQTAGAGSWVVTVHGFADTKVEHHRMFVKIARRLAKNGIGVLRIDLVGSGDSEGDFEDMTVSGEISQTLAVIDWLRGQPELKVSKVGLLGFSLGGLIASYVAVRAEGVKTLALWAPVSDGVLNMINYFGMENVYKGLIDDVVGAPDGDAVRGSFFKELRQFDAVMELEKFTQPVLLVQGTKDQAVLPVNAQRYEKAFRNPSSRVHYIDGASHRFDTIEYEKELLDITEEWFSTQLLM
jgi:pimeloyl-ACP methyl ester carboxylesterase